MRQRWAPCFRLAFRVALVASLAGALEFQGGSLERISRSTALAAVTKTTPNGRRLAGESAAVRAEGR